MYRHIKVPCIKNSHYNSAVTRYCLLRRYWDQSIANESYRAKTANVSNFQKTEKKLLKPLKLQIEKFLKVNYRRSGMWRKIPNFPRPLSFLERSN